MAAPWRDETWSKKYLSVKYSTKESLQIKISAHFSFIKKINVSAHLASILWCCVPCPVEYVLESFVKFSVSYGIWTRSKHKKVQNQTNAYLFWHRHRHMFYNASSHSVLLSDFCIRTRSCFFSFYDFDLRQRVDRKQLGSRTGLLILFECQHFCMILDTENYMFTVSNL